MIVWTRLLISEGVAVSKGLVGELQIMKEN